MKKKAPLPPAIMRKGGPMKDRKKEAKKRGIKFDKRPATYEGKV